MKRKNSVLGITFDAVNLIFMCLVVFLTAYPFIYILIYSVSDPNVVGSSFLLYPKGFNLDSYKAAFEYAEIPHALLVSVTRSVLGPALTIIVTSMVAYPLTREDLIGRKIVSRYFIFTMYFSSGMIPVYLLYSRLGLSGTYWVYILPLLMNVFDMILIKTYIESLPKSLEESARLDGANDIQLFFKIIFPLCKPIIAAVFLFECVNHWNSFMDTMLYNAQNDNLHTLQYVLVNFVETRTSSIEQAKAQLGFSRFSSTSLRMSITVIVILPILFVYPFLQKYFAKGLMVGAVKG